jgi:hypothetical protein
MRGLLNKGFRPEIILLETIPPGGDWEKSERDWIDKERRAGMPLTNLTMGGDHGFCGKHSEESKRKLSKKMIGNKYALGHKWTEEERQNHLKAVNHEKMSLAQSKNYPAFINEQTGQRIPSGKNLAKLCRLMGLTGSTMSSVVLGKIRSHKGWVLARGVEC